MHQEYYPPIALQHTIKCFWYNKTNLGESISGFEVVPDGFVEIIFHFGNGCSIQVNGALQPLPSPFLMGLLGHPAHFFGQGCLEIIAVRCYPWAVFDLLMLPCGNGIQVFEHPVAALHPALADCIANGRIEDAIAHVQQYFLAEHSKSTVNTLLYKAGTAMAKANGTLPVSQVAQAAHATVRTLERRFKKSSGHTVKDVSALMRFEQARNRLWYEPEVNLAALAHELGYADQSHLSREFKKYSGTTPGAFARKSKKNRKLTDIDFVVFVQS